jgi:formylglycine-generating enzyme required for sulfatase activity
MGSEDFYPEERPVRQVEVDGFWIDEHPVTVAEFRRFVQATGYVTVAERPLDPAQYPDADPDLLHPGSLVFYQASGPVGLTDVTKWWRYTVGASWRHPRGPESTVSGLDLHPVTHVAAQDAEAYASWAGKELASEAEWEFAARGGLEGAVFTWGDEMTPRGKVMANTWQGEFPWQSLGKYGTSPVRSFPPNGYGLYDMAGNVWEWTSDYFLASPVAHGCCVPRNPRVTSAEQSLIPGEPGGHIPRRVIKGGSHLCAPNYCLRYRPAARQGEAIDTSTGHLGFRCIVRGTALPLTGRRQARPGTAERPVVPVPCPPMPGPHVPAARQIGAAGTWLRDEHSRGAYLVPASAVSSRATRVCLSMRSGTARSLRRTGRVILLPAWLAQAGGQAVRRGGPVVVVRSSAQKSISSCSVSSSGRTPRRRNRPDASAHMLIKMLASMSSSEVLAAGCIRCVRGTGIRAIASPSSLIAIGGMEVS